MSQAHTREYHRIGEDKRIQIITLHAQCMTMTSISRQTKVKLETVADVIHKWRLHHTVRDLPKTGRPGKVDDRTRRRFARMMQAGEVTTAPQLTQALSTLGIAQVSTATTHCELHRAGLKAMRLCEKPLLTSVHKKRRLEFAREHRNWTVDDWKQVIFSHETVITARPLHLHGRKWTKPTDRLHPRLIVPAVQGGGPAVMTWGCISKYGLHNIILLQDTLNAAGWLC